MTKSVGNKFSKSLMGWERVAECYSVHPSLSAGGMGGGGVNFLPNSKNRGLDRTSVFRGVAGKEGVTFFRGGFAIFQ